jgi:hypothetical protein
MYFYREDILGFIDEETNGVPLYKISDNPVEAGFVDITSIENLHNFGKRVVGHDYKCIRDFLGTLVEDSGGFAAQNDTIKYICCIHKLGTHNEMKTFLGSQQALIALMKVYKYNTSISRESRAFEAEVTVRNELPNNHKELLTDVRDIFINYLIYGVEGIDKGDNEGLLDYLIAKVGTSWEGLGLINKAWTPETMTITELSNFLYNIIDKGDYYYTPAPNKSFIWL